MVGSIWAILKGIFGWAWENKNIAGYIMLAIIIAFLTWDRNRTNKKIEEMTIEAGKLPDDIEFIASMRGTKFKITFRDSKNNVVHKEYYVPEEGGIDITKKISLKNYDPNSPITAAIAAASNARIPTLNPLNRFLDRVLGPTITPGSDTNVNVRTRGFTFKPGISGIWDGGFRPQRPVTIGLDAKIFYINRYSAGIGTTIDYPYLWASRHVDDLVPFITINHLEIMLGYGKPYSDFSNSVLTLGGRTNF